MEIEKKFWTVMVNGRPGGTKRHETYSEAANEAHRLCMKEYAEVFVLEAVTLVKPNPSTISMNLI